MSDVLEKSLSSLRLRLRVTAGSCDTLILQWATDAEWRRCSAGAERLTMNHYVHVPDEFAYYRPARPEGRARNQTRQTVERVYGSPYRDPAQRNLPWDETTRGQAAHSNRTDWRESQQRSQEWSGGTLCARGIYDA